MQSKKLLFLKFAVGCIGCLTVASLALYAYDKARLQKLSSVTSETGLVFPDGVKIVGTKADRYSLADGANFGWLIESPQPLTDWLKANMKREDDDGLSWKHIQAFSEVAPLATGAVAGLRLDGVWRAACLVHGRNETSYLFVADGRTNAYLETFRP